MTNVTGGTSVCVVNEDEVVQRASEHGSGDPSLFSSALNHVNSNKARSDRPLTSESLFG